MNITIFGEHQPVHSGRESQYPYKDETQVRCSVRLPKHYGHLQLPNRK